MMVNYCKLHDGSWGLKGERFEEAAEVAVTTKAGKVKTEKVGKIIWKKDDLMIATIHRPEQAAGVCGECGCKLVCACTATEEDPF